MQAHELSSPVGSRKKRRVLGRGPGSGAGKTAGRGLGRKQKARSGRGILKQLEGGQMPLLRRLPKIGFNSKRPTLYQLVQVSSLSRFKAGTVVDGTTLKEKGIIKSVRKPFKILGEGELKNAVTIKADAFSKSALDKITKAGGKAEPFDRKTLNTKE